MPSKPKPRAGPRPIRIDSFSPLRKCRFNGISSIASRLRRCFPAKAMLVRQNNCSVQFEARLTQMVSCRVTTESLDILTKAEVFAGF